MTLAILLVLIGLAAFLAVRLGRSKERVKQAKEHGDAATKALKQDAVVRRGATDIGRMRKRLRDALRRKHDS